MSGTGRHEWRKLAKERLADLKALRAQERWSGVYHVAGLAVECGLKAIIAKKFLRGHFPEKNIEKKIFVHEASKLSEVLPDLVKVDLSTEIRTNSNFAIYWQQVVGWNIDSRYVVYGQVQADDIYIAVTERKHGVFRWLRRHW